jgi:hypothetical protein
MARLIDRPIDRVRTAPGGHPRSFRWRGKAWRVDRTTEIWKDSGCWWEGEGEKVFFRVEIAGGRLAEVYFDRRAEKWYLYRVYD